MIYVIEGLQYNEEQAKELTKLAPETKAVIIDGNKYIGVERLDTLFNGTY